MVAFTTAVESYNKTTQNILFKDIDYDGCVASIQQKNFGYVVGIKMVDKLIHMVVPKWVPRRNS